MSEDRLEQLATRAGLAIEWIDAFGQTQKVTSDNLRNLLNGLGYKAETEADLQQGLQRLEHDEQLYRLPPLLTAAQGEGLDLSRYFTADQAFELTLEDGTSSAGRLDASGHLSPLSNVGYHQLQVGDQVITLAVAPSSAPSVHNLTGKQRAWGLGVQLYALRRQGDGGLGDLNALEQLVGAAAAAGADALAISPVHAMFSADSHKYSPYSPSSRLFHNVLHSAPEALFGPQAVADARQVAGVSALANQLEALPLIDWPAAAQVKLRLLQALYQGFLQNEHPLRQDFQRFRLAGGEALENHCRFEALHGRRVAQSQDYDWRDWPAALRDPGHPEVAAFAHQHAVTIGFHAFCQWLMDRGLTAVQKTAREAGMGIGLIADLAVGADGAGSQAWSRQDEVLANLSLGAPPDVLNRTGQGWGISGFSPAGLRRHGFRAFIEMLRANLAHAGGLRIDHVMGLSRLWVIPRGASPLDGAYLHYPLVDLLRLVTLEAVRHQALILGEDLGTVPAGFRQQLIERRLLGMRVLLFEQDGYSHYFRPPGQWDANALATTSTHDLPTLAGWWQGNDIEWRARVGQTDDAVRARDQEVRGMERRGLAAALTEQGLLDGSEAPPVEAVVDAAMTFVGRTPAPFVLLPVEDALGLTEQANLPGDIDRHPNWRRRWPDDSQVLLENRVPRRRMELLNSARRQSEGSEP